MRPGMGKVSGWALAGIVAALILPQALGCATSARPSRTRIDYINLDGQRALPFSDAVRAGNLLFVSGQLGVDDRLQPVPGGIQAETRAAMDHIRRIVEASGSSMDRMVKCTCMLADMNEWQKMNEVYVTYFPPGRLPARSAFEAGRLALGARVEIECIAAVGD
jgi:reactive intermediate/imine deaminase